MLDVDSIFIAIMLFLCSLGLISIFLLYLMDFLAKKFFSKTDAYLIEYDINQTKSFITDLNTVYSIGVSYVYIYNRKEYKSTRLNIRDSVISSKEKIENMIEEIKINNDRILVYVCPFKPNYSIVFPMKFANREMIFIFFIFFFGFIISCYLGYVQF